MKGVEQNFTHAIGSEHRYKYSNLFPLLISDGAKQLSEKYQCYWLLDVIGSYLGELRKDSQYLAIATLEHNPEEGKPNQFKFYLRDDIPANTMYAEQDIEFSDFPEQGVKLYVGLIENNQYLAYLPQEH